MSTRFNLDYLERHGITRDVAGAMTTLLLDAGFLDASSAIEDPSQVFNTRAGQMILQAFIDASHYSSKDVIPRSPDLIDAGYPQSIPVIWNKKAGAALYKLLVKARLERDKLDTSSGLDAMVLSLNTYFERNVNGSAADNIVNGGLAFLPLNIDWNDREAAGDFGEYLNVPKFVLTHHTLQQVYVKQLVHSFSHLKPEEVTPELAHEIRLVKTILQESVNDLALYYFDEFSIPRLHTDRVIRDLFSDTRGHRTHIARFALNLTEINDVDAEKLGSFVLDVMRKWLDDRRGKMRSSVQSAEKTTFQFIVESPDDVGPIFEDFERDFPNAMYLEFARRYPDRRSLDEEAKALLRNIGLINVRGSVAVLPIDDAKMVDFAIQEPEDVKIYLDILRQAGFPERSIRLVMDKNFSQESFDSIKPWLKNVRIDFNKMKKWMNEPADEKDKQARKDLFQAFMIQGVFYALKHLTGVLDYFEKEMSSKDAVAVYTENMLPGENDFKGRAKLDGYLAQSKYVSDGSYNPAVEHPELMKPELVSHLPHLKVLLEREKTKENGSHPRVSRILQVWERLSREWGELTHSPRPGNRGGAKEIFFNALTKLERAAESGNQDEIKTALAEVKSSGGDFADRMKYIWARAIADPTNAFFLKREVRGRTSLGASVNTDVFTQEYSRLGFTCLTGIEADSIQRHLQANGRKVTPAFADEPFQEVWGAAPVTAGSWGMPIPLMVRPGGDLVLTASFPSDASGSLVSPVAFALGVTSEVDNKYRTDPFDDVKKVKLYETHIELSDESQLNTVNDILFRTAEELDLETVPYILHAKEGGFTLYTSQTLNWRTKESLSPELVVAKLKEKGLSISSHQVSKRPCMKRMNIYVGAGQSQMYRFSNFSLEKFGFVTFNKHLTLTAVTGFSGAISSRAAYERYLALCAELKEGVEKSKDAKWPAKAGFEIHPSLHVTEEDANSFLETSASEFLGFSKHLSENVLRDVDSGLKTYLSAVGVPAKRQRLDEVSKLSREKWLPEISLASNRFKTSGAALDVIVRESGGSIPDYAVLEAARISKANRDAAEVFTRVEHSLMGIEGLAANPGFGSTETFAIDASASFALQQITGFNGLMQPFIAMAPM